MVNSFSATLLIFGIYLLFVLFSKVILSNIVVVFGDVIVPDSDVISQV